MRTAASLTSTPYTWLYSVSRIAPRLGVPAPVLRRTNRRRASTRKTPDPHERSRTLSVPVRPSNTSSSTSETAASGV